MVRQNHLTPYLLIFLLAVVLFVPFLGSVPLFDWDEVNFAESAREMLLTGNYFQVQVNYQPFWEKPPLFFWLQVLSMKAFGINDFAARFPNALCGCVTLLLIFHLGKKYFSLRTGWLWVACYLGALTPHLYFKSGIIDPWFNLFIFLGIVQLARAAVLDHSPKRMGIYLLAGACIGLAILTKGPVAVLIVLLCLFVFWLSRGFSLFFHWKDVVLFTIGCAVVSFAWYGPETLKNGIWFIREFMQYQAELFTQPVATHGQPWYYHPLVILVGCFPISIIAIRGWGEILTKTEEQKVFKQWMSILFWVVLILFSLVKTKIVHYSSLCYLPLTFLAALAIENVWNGKIQFRRTLLVLLAVTGTGLGILFTAIPLLMSNAGLKARLIATMKDDFAVANFSQPVVWGGWEFLIGIAFTVCVIVGIVLLAKKKYRNGFLLLLVSTGVTLQLFLLAVVPKIEQYSQGGAVEFLTSLQGKDCYVETLGYKSYAQYWYPKVPPREPEPAALQAFILENSARYAEVPATDRFRQLYIDWLLHGQIDKPAYFICKNIHYAEYSSHPNLEKTGEKGGFVFLKRK